MNDLTKDELGIIYCNLAVNEKTKDILLKIESIFNNYKEETILVRGLARPISEFIKDNGD